MIALIIAALLASGVGLGAPLRYGADAAAYAPSGEPSVERVHKVPFERGDVHRTAYLRATAQAIWRVQTPGGAAGSDRPRAAMLGAEPSRLALLTRRPVVEGADVRLGQVPRPELTAHSSRAPPTV